MAGGGLHGIDAVVLAGGLGTRIRGVLGDTPKVLAPINGRPFLDHLADWLAIQGAGRIVLALGHLADKVCSHLAARVQPLPVDWVIEDRPLGTGGALRLARPRLGTDPVLVMNGDTWLETDLGAFRTAHEASGKQVSLLCIEVDDVSRYGSLEINSADEVVRFVEKDPDRHGAGVVNGGVSLYSAAALDRLMLSDAISLEADFLGRLPSCSIHAHRVAGARFVDIGTPASLASAGGILPSA